MPFDNFDFLPDSPHTLKLPDEMYHKFKDDMNNALFEYGMASDSSDASKAIRIASLKKMQESLRYVELRLPPLTQGAKSPFYQKKAELFVQIKEAYALDGITSLFDEERDKSEIGEIIANMSQEMAEMFGLVLSSETDLGARLAQLFASIRTEEARRLEVLFTANHIEFVGGNNSKNYLFRSGTTQKVKVLKLESRLEMPRHIEDYLRKRLPHIFATIDSEREVAIGSGNEVEIRTLQVTEYCPGGSVEAHGGSVEAHGGSVEAHGAELRKQGVAATHIGAADVIGQMAQVFLDIQKENCCFSDSKISNWLVDGQGKIRISDTKSFVFTKNGKYIWHLDGNEGVRVLRTPAFEPLDLASSSFEADKVHAAILGRNLYVYLTGEWPDEMDLTAPLSAFSGDIGKEYKELIAALVIEPYSKRISVQEAQIRLLSISFKLDPQYRDLKDKATLLSQSTGIMLLPLFDEMLKTEAKLPLNTKNAILDKMQGVLSRIEANNQEYDGLMQEIATITHTGLPTKTPAELLAYKKSKFQNMDSLEKLDIKLMKGVDFFKKHRDGLLLSRYEKLKTDLASACKTDILEEPKASMKQFLSSCDSDLARATSPAEKAALTKKHSDLFDFFLGFGNERAIYRQFSKMQFIQETYEGLKRELKALGYGADAEMQAYLSSCDAEINLGQNYEERLDRTQQIIAPMTAMLKGLSRPENQMVQSLTEDVGGDSKQRLWTEGGSIKAQRVLKAMQEIPLAERANLLKSEHPKTKELWKAVAACDRTTVSIHVANKAPLEDKGSEAKDLAMEKFLKKIRVKFKTEDEPVSQTFLDKDPTYRK